MYLFVSSRVWSSKLDFLKRPVFAPLIPMVFQQSAAGPPLNGPEQERVYVDPGFHLVIHITIIPNLPKGGSPAYPQTENGELPWPGCRTCVCHIHEQIGVALCGRKRMAAAAKLQIMGRVYMALSVHGQVQV